MGTPNYMPTEQTVGEKKRLTFHPVYSFARHQPQRVDHAREAAQKRQDNVEPEVQAQADLHESRYRRQENGDYHFD